MMQAGPAQNDAAGDVDEIGGGHKVADDVENPGHGFARENIAGEEDAGQDGEESELHGFLMGVGFAGDQDDYRERNEDVRQGQDGQQDDAAVNRHLKREAHEGED